MLREFIKPAGITSVSERVRFSDISPEYLEDGAFGEIMGLKNYSSPQPKIYQWNGVFLFLRA